MNTRFSSRTLLVRFISAFFLLLAKVESDAAIIGISIPEHSQCPICRPSIDNVWSVSCPPFPLNDNLGVGIIVKPTIVLDGVEFAMHQNQPFFPPSPPYVASFTPDPTMAAVTYTFDHPQIVSGVDIAQHQNGITRVEGLLGNSLDVLGSIGSVFGPSGDVTSGWVVDIDGTVQRFNFANSTISGTIFRLVVRKSVHPFAFATYRIFPIDQNGNRIPPAASQDPVTLIQNLILEVAALNLAHGIENSLDVKLNAAVDLLQNTNQGDDANACANLQAFINEVNAQSGKKITPEEALELVEHAGIIKDVLNCP